MEKILLTGFEAFGNTPINPAELVAKALNNTQIDNAYIVSHIVPNTFFKSIDYVIKLINETQPKLVIMMGEYAGRTMITIERIAHNLNDATRYQLTDNAGKAPQDQLTIPDGPTAYYSTLPIRAMTQAVRNAGIPADISDTAGTFCCNHLMYGILHYISTHKLSISTGWIHLPHLPCVAALPEHIGAPSMSLETSIKGVKIAISAALNNKHDTSEPILSRLQI